MSTHHDPAKLAIAKALGRIPSGVSILTTHHDGRDAAMLASWVQQASFEPLAVTIAVAKSRPILAIIHASRLLALSIVPESDTALMKRYARGTDGDRPFDGLKTTQTARGLNVLTDALAWIEAELVDSCDFGGDHELLIARVTGGEILKPGHAFTHQRGSGLHY